MTMREEAPNHYDAVIIGAGPAGYVCAIRCAQLGLKTACIDDWLDDEQRPVLGGTCLNAGCIPSKALLESSEHYASLKEPDQHPGISLQGLSLDLDAVQSDKHRIVTELTAGIATLFRANGIEWIAGRATLHPNRHIQVSNHGDGAGAMVTAEHVVIATGSRPIDIPAARVDGKLIVDSQGALAFDSVPERLGIIGAGVIGLEMGSVWNRFGSRVTLLEAQELFLPPVDRDIAAIALAEFRQQGLDIRLVARVTKTTCTDQSVAVTFEHEGKEHEIEFDRLVVAVGRRPCSDGFTVAEVELTLEQGGFIHVDENWETSVPGVYAIGDVTVGPMLAHKGSAEGIAVAEILSGRHAEVNYGSIPGVVYTDPELAWAGRNETDLRNAGIPFRSGRFPFSASGRARAMGKTAGMVKMLTHEKTDEILGIHIVGENASELIAEAVLAMEYKATSEDLAMTIHAHPTLSEVLHEAALAVNGEAIHLANKRSLE
jgi:dihydrolipoamide dehydrogenase